MHTLALQVIGEEMLVSGSDDFTMFLWKPSTEKQSLARWLEEIRLELIIYYRVAFFFAPPPYFT